jgi:hypothetical protein
MEKITLKPQIKELVFRNGEPDTSFDVQSFQGSSVQEKLLGSLFVVSHAKYSNEDLAYSVSLVSSLAKREYYSDTALQEQNSKAAFESTLKKLNEVLDDFFKNKDLKLNIGLLAISGDNVYISRLGKFKMALARDDDYIDVLNNIDLFSKDSEDEKQFSNIISGKLKAGDKIFAYFPAKSITLREKILNPVFVKENQDDFSQKIALLASNANNFSCCGVHIAMQEIKEIPVQFKPKYSMPSIIKAEVKTETPVEKPVVVSYMKTSAPQQVDDEDPEEDTTDQPEETPEEPVVPQKNTYTEQPKVVSAEISVSKRGNMLTPMAEQFAKLASIGRLPRRARTKMFIVIAAIVIVPLLAFVVIKNSGNSGKVNTAINQAKDSLKAAQTRLTQNDRPGARISLEAALLDVSGYSGKNVETVRQQITKTLDTVNNVSDKVPTLFSSSLTEVKDFKANLITASNNKPFVVDMTGNAFAIEQASATQLGQLLKTPVQFLSDAKATVFAFNGADTFGVYGTSKKVNAFKVKPAIQAVSSSLYENNLYVLLADQILKYADAGTGSTKSTKWSKDAIVNPLSLTVDGNVFVLSKDGKIATYFKGTKKSEFDTQMPATEGSKILTGKDLAFIYLADKTNKRVYVFDKSSGELKTTFKLDAVGTVQDIAISQNGNVWVLSAEGKVWEVQP